MMDLDGKEVGNLYDRGFHFGWSKTVSFLLTGIDWGYDGIDWSLVS